MKRQKIPIDILLEECLKAMKKEIRKDLHDEAKEILQSGSDEDRKEFMKLKVLKDNVLRLKLKKN